MSQIGTAAQERGELTKVNDNLSCEHRCVMGGENKGGYIVFNRKSLLGLFGALSFCAAATPASAQLVTYSWTTTSQGFGNNLGQPTTATFQVALSKIQTGHFSAQDITNINLAYPGLTFNAFTASSGGLD